MKIFLYLFVLFALISLQITLLPHLVILNSYPNFLLLAGITFTLLGRNRYALITILVGGFLLDLLSPFRLGLITLSLFLPIAILTFVFSKILLKPNILFAFLSIMLISLIYELTVRIFLQSPLNLNLLSAVLYSSVLGTLVYSLALKIIHPIELKFRRDVHL